MNANKLYTKFSIEKIWNKLKQHDKAMNSVLLILLPSNWVEQDGKYKNTVQYSGFKSSDKLTVDLYDDGNLADLQLTEYEHYIDGFEIIDGALVAIASVKPTQTMTVVVKGGFQANESEVGDLSVIEDELNFLANRPVNNNILINSNFANPVNQRGITAETWVSGQYGLDRWMQNQASFVFPSETHPYLTVGVSNGFTASSFYQIFEHNGQLDSTLTCSLKINGEIFSKTFTKTLSELQGSSELYDTNKGYSVDLSYKGDNPALIIRLTSSDVVLNVEWVKLEVGEVATPYVPRLYAEELQLCKRYYKRCFLGLTPYGIDSNNIFFQHNTFDLYWGMRTYPTVDICNYNIAKGTTGITGFTLTNLNWGGHSFAVKFTKTNHGVTANDYGVLAQIDCRFDAEL